MISGRAILLTLLLGLLACLAVRAPGVWLYDAIARRLRRGQSAASWPDANRPPGNPGAASRRTEQVRQPG